MKMRGYLTQNFKTSEFACKCGKCTGIPDEKINNIKTLASNLQRARTLAGIPFVINSAYRCQEYNDSLPGSAKDSAHLSGLAVDIGYKDNHEKFLILKALFATDFPRIGYNPKKKFIHADLDKVLDVDSCHEIFWDY